MITQLQKIFPTLIEYDHVDITNLSNFAWFETECNRIFGIHQEELTEKDKQLLTTFLTPYNISLPDKTELERIWYNRIHKDSNQEQKLDSEYRFIYFSMSQHQIEPLTFKEAIHELFNRPIPIIWLNDFEGIIIEQLSHIEDEVNYEQIIDIFMADLSIKIKFFIGYSIEDLSNINTYYTTIVNTGKLVFKLSNKLVIHYTESIPYLLLKNMDESERMNLIASTLKGFQDDDTMLQTIESFLQNNLNVSETAKIMYMHRNSLQYRIDKFINGTGVNVQQFDEALAVKFAILAKRTFDSLHE